jgi:hypothetical protein
MKALLAAILFAAGQALAGTVGQPAPDFTLADLAGKPITAASTAPYGCSIKY